MLPVKPKYGKSSSLRLEKITFWKVDTSFAFLIIMEPLWSLDFSLIGFFFVPIKVIFPL